MQSVLLVQLQCKIKFNFVIVSKKNVSIKSLIIPRYIEDNQATTCIKRVVLIYSEKEKVTNKAFHIFSRV